MSRIAELGRVNLATHKPDNEIDTEDPFHKHSGPPVATYGDAYGKESFESLGGPKYGVSSHTSPELSSKWQ